MLYSNKYNHGINPTMAHKPLTAQRLTQIRQHLQRDRAVHLEKLSEVLGVSVATVRRDLDTLERQGEAKRVHGGAVLTVSEYVEPVFDEKATLFSEEKSRIAAKAAELVMPGETIFLDGGSTVLALARLLREFHGLNVVTNSLRAASELSGGGPSVVIVGGALRRISQTMVGSLTRLTLEAMHFDKAFMGTLGFTLSGGITTTDPDEAFTKELVMQRSKQVLLLADHSKVGIDSFARSGLTRDIHTLITDTGADPNILKPLAEAGLNIIQA